MTIVAYHRPARLAEAVLLLNRTDVASVPLAGGTTLNAHPPEGPVEVVDLQAVGLDGIGGDAGGLEIGAMVRLRQLVEDERVPALLRELAQREAPSTFRNMATVGGTVAAAGWESELLAGLLAFEATVTVEGADGSTTVPLEQLLDNRAMLQGAIITTVRIATDGRAAIERTGRTPADVPIVAAVARRTGDGSLRLVLTGVAETPTVVDPAHLASLDPPSDFRGSSEYRSSLAMILARRVTARLGET